MCLEVERWVKCDSDIFLLVCTGNGCLIGCHSISVFLCVFIPLSCVCINFNGISRVVHDVPCICPVFSKNRVLCSHPECRLSGRPSSNWFCGQVQVPHIMFKHGWFSLLVILPDDNVAVIGGVISVISVLIYNKHMITHATVLVHNNVMALFHT